MSEKINFNKAQIIETVHKHMPEGWTQADAAAAFDAVVEGLKEILATPNATASVVGFATFTNKPYGRAERQGRNPATGESITIPARSGAKPAVKFSPKFNEVVETAWAQANKPAKKASKKAGGKKKASKKK